MTSRRNFLKYAGSSAAVVCYSRDLISDIRAA